jgi:thiaminase/transcriptional activator TenA
MAQNSFSAQLRGEAQGIWSAIDRHPFLRELHAGTLPIESFRYFILQDYHYLGYLARTVAIAISKAPDSPTLQLLAKRLERPVERLGHKGRFEKLEMDLAEVEKAQLAPTNLAYVNHMLVSASQGSIGDAAASLLPCAWTYNELGRVVHGTEHPVYKEWANFYDGAPLQESVDTWRGFIDKQSAGGGPADRERMRRIFLTSMRYEFQFWDMAYKLERWPLT